MDAEWVSDSSVYTQNAYSLRLTVRSPPSASVLLAADQTTARDVGQGRRLTVTQSDIEMLALARASATQKSSHDAVACIETGCKVCHGDPNLHWRTISRPGDVHQAELGLDHNIVPCALRIRARLPIPGDGGVDECRVDLIDRLEVQPILLQRSRDVVLNKNITLGGEFVEDIDPS